MKRQLKLIKLELKNFKGVRHFVLDAQGKNLKVYGDNATGKTTVFDSFIWLLFDKDSNNRSDFAIKTLDGNNNELHGLEHEVEGVFELDGTEITLRKVFSEKWTKKRGSATKEFTGHTTDYYIDGVPSKLKEYKDKVSQIVEEDVFKLLTSPSYFNDQLKWQKRREILLEICGDISDQDVIASNKKLAELPEILNGRSIENLRKIIASKRTEINKELDKIPVRIDEVQRTMPDLSELNEKNLANEITQYKSWIEEKEAELSRIRNGAEVSHKEKELKEIETELIDLKNQHYISRSQKTNDKRKEVYILEDKAESIQFEINKAKRAINDGETTIQRLTNLTEALRTRWREVNSRDFNYNGETECPSCGQDLPAEKVVAAIEKAEASFNQKKSQELGQINNEGKDYAETIKKLKKENETNLSEIAAKEIELVGVNESIDGLKKEIAEIENSVTDIAEMPGYQEKKKEAEDIKLAINQLKSSTEETISKVKNEIVSLKTKLNDIELVISKFALAKQAKQRIVELSEQERELAKEFEKLEKQLYLTEEFIRCKVQLLEEKINSKFKFARFKLFDQQINDGLKENCETLYKGVPYSSGLNNAARINIGLDIINTLSDHYGFAAPIFVDNSEAVTKLIDVKTQIISLVVSEKDKELRVEGCVK